MENERYFNLYGIHKEDKNNYDLVIDTSDKTPEQVKNEILKQYKLWQKS
jgi:cytidylate kinase